MIEVLKNADGFVYAYTCFERVNQDGKPDDNGHFLFVSDMWVHPWHEKGKCIVQLIGQAAALKYNDGVKYVYEEREKNGKKIMKIFHAQTFRRKGLSHEFKKIQ